jgi:plasmid maintenance system antidote protein VapI
MNTNDKQHTLLDTMRQLLNLPTDAALARKIGVNPPVISKIRGRTLPVGATMLIKLHEATDMSIRELKSLRAAS